MSCAPETTIILYVNCDWKINLKINKIYLSLTYRKRNGRINSKNISNHDKGELSASLKRILKLNF